MGYSFALAYASFSSNPILFFFFLSPLSDSLYFLAMIESRHGKVTDLRFFLNPTDPGITDFSKTLADIGIAGGTKSENKTVTLYYDFKSSMQDPILLLEPDLSKIDKNKSSQPS